MQSMITKYLEPNLHGLKFFCFVFCVLLMILWSLYCKVTWCQSTILVAPRVIRQCEDTLLIYEDLYPTTHTTQARSSTDPHTTHPTSTLIFFRGNHFLKFICIFIYIHLEKYIFKILDGIRDRSHTNSHLQHGQSMTHHAATQSLKYSRTLSSRTCIN